MKGRVIRSTGSWYSVQIDEHEIVDCRIRGKFRTKGLNLTNPVAVGDIVEFDLEEDKNSGIIHTIYPRKNHIIRKAASNSKQDQIVASNLDVALLVATLIAPETSTGFLDRFLLTAEVYNVPAMLIINKSDLYESQVEEELDEIRNIYDTLNYKTIIISALTKDGFDEFENHIKDKTCLIAGNSGVGKTTILNALDPSLDLRVQEISDYSGKGTHSTTFAEMHHFEKINARIIDTPGIKEFGLVDIDKNEVSHFFPEMREMIGQCQYNDCLHVNEPNCVIKEAVDSQNIHLNRYKNYLSILSDY
ncbi:ribosome small subunit-dependent GTPase A [bacterium AH-315-C07]|nr:ribosome small subunit-dependent GTPase A [bacterium AH-315-C07]